MRGHLACVAIRFQSLSEMVKCHGVVAQDHGRIATDEGKLGAKLSLFAVIFGAGAGTLRPLYATQRSNCTQIPLIAARVE